jgi:hypothetical protein
MFELKETLNNLIRCRILLDLHRAIIFTNDRLLLSEITHTLED